MNTLHVLNEDFSHVECTQCKQPLALTPVELVYLESKFSVELPACKQCGFVLIPEPLALSKMAEVERLLEDK